eukprot:NODE_3285_length_1007_cov_47.593946_g3021_i0.p2 GENE.NODE_3285_length_1007_cov_47.593946_g3021_i0~~NODE_3285_length_1007_cov_47.593946_g3021_i0.p2  ORF type:complete len:259 (-),score=57.81 NODE_3285_length_1007_cov_47.593946_g3021_i0:137-913(-)
MLRVHISATQASLALLNPKSHVRTFRTVRMPTGMAPFAGLVSPMSQRGYSSGFLRVRDVSHLSDLKPHLADEHASEEELAAKVYGRLVELEAQVLQKAKEFEAIHHVSMLPDPRTWASKASNEIFLYSALCFVLFAIFLYGQYVEFAHELYFDIRDGPLGAGFYFLLGLHGSHVVIGAGMLAVLSALAWQNAINPQSVLLRATSLYIHLVDLVFVVLVFTVYGGLGSTHHQHLISDQPPLGQMIIEVEEDGKIVEIPR